MSSLAAPFGLRPAYSPAGVVRPGPLVEIASAYAVNIFQYSPVRITAAGTIEVAAAGTTSVGTFMGVEYDIGSLIVGLQTLSQRMYVRTTLRANSITFTRFRPTIH